MTERRHGDIIDFGDSVRLERHFAQEKAGGFRWSVYRLNRVAERHPVHDTETTEREVWVKVFEGTEDESRAQAEEIAG